jgi:predicted RecB family nuclease
LLGLLADDDLFRDPGLLGDHSLLASLLGLKPRCTLDNHKRVKRSQHEDVLDRMQDRLDRMPEAMLIRRQTVEHPFGTIKAWMGSTHFLMKTLEKVKTEMSLHVLAYNLKRMISILGVRPLLRALAA